LILVDFLQFFHYFSLFNAKYSFEFKDTRKKTATTKHVPFYGHNK